MGAKIKGYGSSTITIEGVSFLKGCEYTILPDRIEAATFLIAAATTSGFIRLNGILASICSACVLKLKEAGAVIKYQENWIEIDMRKKRPKAVTFNTAPYPAIPTDIQAQFTAMNAISSGIGCITETIFENRFRHIPEMKNMGANIRNKR